MPVCSCTRLASDTNVSEVEPKSRTMSGLAATSRSRLTVSPRPVSRPVSGRSRAGAARNSFSAGEGVRTQPTMASRARV